MDRASHGDANNFLIAEYCIKRALTMRLYLSVKSKSSHFDSPSGLLAGMPVFLSLRIIDTTIDARESLVMASLAASEQGWRLEGCE
jgi:hypothetical protein